MTLVRTVCYVCVVCVMCVLCCVVCVWVCVCVCVCVCGVGGGVYYYTKRLARANHCVNDCSDYITYSIGNQSRSVVLTQLRKKCILIR